MKRKRSADRAVRLQKEASNCVASALVKTDAEFAAELIDEAVRLAARSRELAALAD